MTDAGPTSLARSFHRNVSPSGRRGSCWPWLAGVCDRGYGRTHARFGVRQRVVGAHRIAYFLATGRWFARSSGMVIRHLCHNPACCNPAHLAEGTLLDNAFDQHSRRMGWPLRNAAGELVWPFDLPVHQRPTVFPEPAA